MHFWIVMKLYFHFLFYQLVSTSVQIFSKNDTFFMDNSADNIFKKFFVDLNKAYLQELRPRYVTVVGTSTDDLHQAQPLLENFPHIICKEPERCALQSQRFSQDCSFVVIFLEDLSKKTFEKNIKILSHCRKCEVLFIANGIVQINDVWLILTLAVKHHLPYSKFAHFEKNVIGLYSDFLTTNCTVQVRLVTVWKPGVGLDQIKNWVLKAREMYGCPVSVSTLDFTPKMMIENSGNGSLKILGGREGKLLLAIAEKLNFTLAVRYPSIESQLKYSRKLAIVYEVAAGVSEIGIGRLRPTNNLNNTIALSFAYDEECETWGVPHVMKWSNGVMWVEFSWKVWALVGLVFAIGFIITYTHSTIIVTPKNSKEKNLGFFMIFLDTVAIHLGNSVVYVSSCAGGRFMLIACLYYGMVMTTAYKTSLASILATDKRTPKIIDAQGIIDSNLKVGGSLYEYKILNDQANDSELTSKLLKRFVINNNNSMPWDVLFFDQDTAFLARRSSLNYERQMAFKKQKRFTFDVLNGCVLSHPTAIAFQATSFLHQPADDIIQHLTESGILDHWDIDETDTDKRLKREYAESYFEERASNKFGEIFIFYSVCIATSIFTFFIELLTSRLVSKYSKNTR